MTSGKAVGFDRKLRLEWLDAAAAKAAEGLALPQARVYLRELLGHDLTGTSFNSDVGKTITVLSRIWLGVPRRAMALRNRALALLPGIGHDERMALHWAMMVGTYPFVLDAAATMGKLMSLQPILSMSLLRRRLFERWGERRMVRNASQVLVRTLADWGVLVEAGRRGEYSKSATCPVRDSVAFVLVEGVLCGSGQVLLPAEVAINHPALFPFELSIRANELRNLPQFEVHRQGLDQDMVGLRERR